MAQYDLNRAGHKNIQFTFRYELKLPQIPQLGLNDELTVFCTNVKLPYANGTAVPAYHPMGIKNNQSGRAETQPIDLEFLVSSDNRSDYENVYKMLNKYRDAGYNLNTGKSLGKQAYSVDDILIRVRKYDGTINNTFQPINAFVTDIDHGTVASEQNELLKVKMTIVYDNLKVYDGNGTVIKDL